MDKLQLNEPVIDKFSTLFADIILPVPLPRLFTYRVPRDLSRQVEIGGRVIVQFGKRKIITGIIGAIHGNPPLDYEAKYILEFLDPIGQPTINKNQLTFFDWMAGYYMCTIGEVLNVAIPSGLKLNSESKVQLHPSFSFHDATYPFSTHETTILDALEGTQNLNYNQINEITGLKNIYTILKSLVKKESIIIYEEIKEKYKPKTERRIRLKKDFVLNNRNLERLFETLGNKQKQVDVLLFYLQKIPVYTQPDKNVEGLLKSEFKSAGLSLSSLKTLMQNEVLEEFEVILSRFPEVLDGEMDILLSHSQKIVQQEILAAFGKNKPVLLHGITGSGKTEIYIKLIEDVVESGHQALFLLPEIALTTQIVSRLKIVFGDKMGVYHSKFSDNERVEVWNGVINERFTFIVGVRSAIFLPFNNLGLIIVDEEHETSYKQMDPAPRYHARDSALYLANLHHSKIILGSATPSVETYYNTTQNRYHLVELHERYGEATLPDIEFADISRERKKKTMKGDFSSVLITALEDTIRAESQAIIFQNRRGYAPYMHCSTCGWIPKCQNCSVSLTYHLYKNELRCHYCGYKDKVPVVCGSCGSDTLNTKSFGTEKLEEDLQLMYPDQKISRMDLDTTRSKYGYQTIIEEFEKGQIDILVGTQMVSKGLDFNNVTLVGIFDADRMIHFPNFRSHERTFQLITQVSGRAGRRNKKGRVVIQTFSPEQPVLQRVKDHDYIKFYQTEIGERTKYKYPPFFRLINIILKHKDYQTCQKAARAFHLLLSNEFGTERTLGPQEGMIARIRNMYLWEILIKFERKKVNLTKVKDIILKKSLELKQEKEFRNIRLIFDVDPY